MPKDHKCPATVGAMLMFRGVEEIDLIPVLEEFDVTPCAIKDGQRGTLVVYAYGHVWDLQALLDAEPRIVAVTKLERGAINKLFGLDVETSYEEVAAVEAQVEMMRAARWN